MASALLAILFAVVVGHTLPDLGRLRDFAWLSAWLAGLGRNLSNQTFWRSPLGLLLSIGLPVLALALVQYLLHERWFGLASFALGAAVLFYSWGPRDLDLDVESLASAP